MPAYIDTGATAVTAANMNDKETQALLEPDLAEEEIGGALQKDSLLPATVTGANAAGLRAAGGLSRLPPRRGNRWASQTRSSST